LRRLAAQIRSQKVTVKLFLRHPLHAKLYLMFRPDPISPTVGYLGSSNLTFAGLLQQGELNARSATHCDLSGPKPTGNADSFSLAIGAGSGTAIDRVPI
jgi:hypothetical protein